MGNEGSRLNRLAASATVLSLPVALVGLYLAYLQLRPAPPPKPVPTEPARTEPTPTQEEVARKQVQALTNAARAYAVRHGQFPATLQALAEPQPDGGPPLVAPEALTDPWGQPYLYAFPGEHNRDKDEPDVWSMGPPGNAGAIGNWPPGR